MKSATMNNELNSNSDEVKAKIEKLDKENDLPFFNCHTHIFNFDHVHDRFLKGMIPLWFRAFLLIVILIIIWLLIEKNIDLKEWKEWIALIILLPFFLFSILDICLFYLPIHSLLRNNRIRKIVKLAKWLIPGKYDFLERYVNLILHSYDTALGKMKSQEDIFKNLKSYYPENTKFITLSMDLDYMVNCKKPQKKSKFDSQLEDLKKIKKDQSFKDRIYPFIHADPRRLESSGQDYFDKLKEGIENRQFQGIKIYPALGYFPFDRRLKPIYDLAVEFRLPIITHCCVGPVFYRGSIKTLRSDGYYENEKFIHPFTGNELEGKSPRAFTPHFTHPLNYYCLMNEPQLLFNYWKKCDKEYLKSSNEGVHEDYDINGLKKYRELKICLAHFGGSDEWINYLQDPWLPTGKDSLTIDENLFHERLGKWKYMVKEDKEDEGDNIKDIKPYSWYSIIADMLLLKDKDKNRVFPNLYSDISYTLSDEKMFPLLKLRLETNKMLAERILFGTDFYMVSTNASERELTIKLRSYIGERNFKQIAVLNPLNFLSSTKTDILNLLD